MYSFEEVKEKFEKLIAADYEPELELRINGTYYMIIGYEGFVKVPVTPAYIKHLLEKYFDE